MIRRHTFEPRTKRQGRHVAPKRKEHTTAPKPVQTPVAANLAPLWAPSKQSLWPVTTYTTPTWDIFEPDSEAWVDGWLSAGERRGNAK